MNPPAAMPVPPRPRSPAPHGLLAATALATLLAQAAPAQPAATDAPPLLAPGAPATLLPPDDLASPDATLGLEAQPELQATVSIAAHFLLYDMNGKYGAEYTFNVAPRLEGQFSRALRPDGTVIGQSGASRENYGAMLNATVGDGYYVEFSSSQSPTVAGYWAAGMPVPGTSNFPIWLVPVDGEAVGMQFVGGDLSSSYPPNHDFSVVELRPLFAQQGPGASIGQTSSWFHQSEPTATYSIDYLEGNNAFGRPRDELVTAFNNPAMTLSWGDPTFGVNVGNFLPYGPIRITCSVEGMSPGVLQLNMQPKYVWVVRPVLFEDSMPTENSLFDLPSVTPVPLEPFPTSPGALTTGAMNQIVSRVNQWEVYER